MRRFATVPWYLRVDKPPAPAVPQFASTVDRLVYSVKQFGLKDVEVQQRERGGGVEQLVLGTGRSARHLATASMQLKTLLKTEFGVLARREGVFTANQLRTEQRRAARRQQRRRLSPTATQLDRTRPPAWVAVDTQVDGISVHFMTAERRAEISFADALDAADAVVDGEESARFDSEYPPADPARADVAGAAAAPGTAPVAAPDAVGSERARIQALLSDPLTTSAAQASEDGLRELCYAHHAEFARLDPTPDAVARFVQQCDEKCARLLAVYDEHLRPANRSILFSPGLLLLLYRMHVVPAASGVSNADALANPEYTRPLRAFAHPRCGVLRDLLIESGALRDTHVAGVLLASLAHAGEFSAFWRVRHLAALYAQSRDQLQRTNELAVALAVRSGNARAVATAVEFVDTHAAPTRDADGFYVSENVKRAMDCANQFLARGSR